MSLSGLRWGQLNPTLLNTLKQHPGAYRSRAQPAEVLLISAMQPLQVTTFSGPGSIQTVYTVHPKTGHITAKEQTLGLPTGVTSAVSMEPSTQDTHRLRKIALRLKKHLYALMLPPVNHPQ